MARFLALFDIDGTLIRRAGPTHRDALIAGVRAVLGVETRNDNIAVHGKLDPDILMEMLANAGVPRRRWTLALPEIYRSAERYYFSNVPDLRRKACPGIRKFLNQLHSREAMIGLVTGNLTRIGWKKLEQAGLDGYFRFGAFGEMASTRTELAWLAVQHARNRGWGADGACGVLIGDTPMDVEAGKANGLETIAVATGLSSLEELRNCRPSLVARDLTDAAIYRMLPLSRTRY